MSKKIDCDRHGGPWGEDETCPRCTNDDGSPRAVPTYTVGLIEPAPALDSPTLDAICAVIDRVKTDERQLDTNEYAGMIENIIRSAS